MFVTENEKQHLLNKYQNRRVFHGQLHDHAATGGTSDGNATLEEWKLTLQSKNMDFVTIVDHRQVLHMRLPEWDNTMFIGGTEAGTTLKDSTATRAYLHYNMGFSVLAVSTR